MKCKKFKDKIILNLYGELSEQERTELETHIKECPECAKDLEYSEKVFQMIDEAGVENVPETDWEKNWKKIDAEIQEKPTKQKAFSLSPRWAYAAAGVLLVFALGIFTGRFWLPKAQENKGPQSASQEFLQQTLKEHFEELKPLLVEYANYASSEEEGDTIVIDKKIVRNLLIQNILLKSVLNGKNPSAEQILEDVDMVLREITHLEKGDTQTPSLIKELIKEREILFKMEILENI